MTTEATPEELQQGLTALIDRGLKFGTCVRAFAEKQSPEELKYSELARNRNRDGELEVDETSVVSLSDDNGAYVMAWLWVNGPDSDHDK
jgi:hypothetical protein